MVSHDILWCIMVSHGVLCCLMVFDGVSFMVSHVVL